MARRKQGGFGRRGRAPRGRRGGRLGRCIQQQDDGLDIDPEYKGSGAVPEDHNVVSHAGFEDDVLGSDNEASDLESDLKRKDKEEEEEEEEKAFLCFDFRRGPEKWPQGATLVDPTLGQDLLKKAKEALAESGRKDKKDKGKSGKGGGLSSDDDDYVGFGSGSYGGMMMGPLLPGAESVSDSSSYKDYWKDSDEDEEEKKSYSAPSDARWEKLSDGSTALIIPAQNRLQLDLEDLLTENWKHRKPGAKPPKKKKKPKYWERWTKRKSKWYKEYINEYTITMDIKLLDNIPRNGLALYQTNLVYAEEQPGSVKKKLRSSEGEAMISGSGGVGTLGKFGDVSKAQVKKGKWHRLVVTVRCIPEGAQEQVKQHGGLGGAFHDDDEEEPLPTKGELNAYLDAKPLGKAKKEVIVEDGRFALDPTQLFLFSSSRADLMPGGIALRYVRVQVGFQDDKEVLMNRAMDKFISVFSEQRQDEADEQRKGLTLAHLFPKPRPIWMAPALVGAFGDAFVEGTALENNSLLAWSFTVLNYALQQCLKESSDSIFCEALSADARALISDVLHVLDSSALIFKHFARLLKHRQSGQLLAFLRRVHKLLELLQEGQAILLPCFIENQDLLLILERVTSQRYRLTVVQTDPFSGLRHHAVSATQGPPKLKFRTCLVLDGINKKNALCDVFWFGVYNLAVHPHEGDMDRFYSLLVPFLTGKPLETSLVEAENAAKKLAESERPGDTDGLFGDWRSPQRSATADVRCLLHGFQFLLRSRGLSRFTCQRVLLSLRVMFLRMIKHDMDHVFPDASGQRVCELACTQLCYCAGKLADKLQKKHQRKGKEDGEGSKTGGAKETKQEKAGMEEEEVELRAQDLERVRLLVQEVRDKLEACRGRKDDLPSRLEISRLDPKEEDEDRCVRTPADAKAEDTQFMSCLAWEQEENEPDPGQAVFLRKYQAIDMLQIPAKATTRDEAVRALRMCERLCALTENQSHCVKNDKFLVLTLIEHVCTHVIPVPKPRGVCGGKETKPNAELTRTIHRRQRRQDRKAKQKQEEVEALKKAKAALSGAEESSGEESKEKKEKKEKQDSKESKEEKTSESLEQDQASEADDSQDETMAATQERRGQADRTGKGQAASRKKTRQRKAKSAGEAKAKQESEKADTAESKQVEEPEFGRGEKVEHALVQEDCIWDQPITYGDQLEIVLTLQRLAEHFAAAVGSTQQSRALDALCLVVPGVLCAIADATLRRRATDHPSEVCSHLMGQTRNGKQLGIPGFGLSTATFASQTETMEVHVPALSVARTAVLDYFQSPQQRLLEKIFTWEDEHAMKPGKTLIRYLRNLNRELSAPVPRPHECLLDRHPTSNLLKCYPELKAFRDIALWWKYWLNSDLCSFPNWSQNGMSVRRFSREQAELVWNWDANKNAYNVRAFCFFVTIACVPDPNKADNITGIKRKTMPTHRYPSAATPAFFLPAPPVRSEDDIIYRPHLPSFDDEPDVFIAGSGWEKQLHYVMRGSQVVRNPKKLQKHVLGQRDSELLLSYLTVPYLRLPLVLSFFATEDRVHKLASVKLRAILEAVLFEPGKYLAVNMTGVEPVMVPSQHPQLLSSPYGLLLNELVRSPHTVLNSIRVLLDSALALDTGSVTEEDKEAAEDEAAGPPDPSVPAAPKTEDGGDFCVSVDIILFTARLAARVDNYVSFLIEHAQQGAPSLREVEITTDCLAQLKEGQQAIQAKLQTELMPLLDDYLLRLDRECVKNPNEKTIVNRNSRLAADLHAHALLLHRNVKELTTETATAILGSFVFLTTRHTWNQFARGKGRLLIPEHELYEVMAVHRRRLVQFHQQLSQGPLDTVLQAVLQMSSSTTGTMRASSELVDANNKWSRIAGPQNVGRFAVGATRPMTTVVPKTGDQALLPPAAEGSAMERLTSSPVAPVGEVADTGLLGVEMELQIGQMTLRSRHLGALPPEILSHPDVRGLFGDATIQSSLLEQAEHRTSYRLVGLNHDLHYWQSPHAECPPLAQQWERDYDPSELFEGEQWIARLFEPVRKSFFNGPSPPPMQFMLPEQAIPEDAELAILLGLHQVLGGPWKLVYVFRRLKCVQVYECVTHGRQWWWALHMATDVRYSLLAGQPDTEDRRDPYPDWWQRGFGDAYPRSPPIAALINDITDNKQNTAPLCSVVIFRDVADPGNLSGGRETLVPTRLLHGLLPSCLFEEYVFWKDESIRPPSAAADPHCPERLPGYMRLRGYPKQADGEYVLLVEMRSVGNWTDAAVEQGKGGKKGAKRREHVLDAIGLPGRSVQVTRVLKSVMEQHFKQRQSLAALIEALRLLEPPARKKQKEESAEEKKKREDALKPLEEGQTVEAEWQGGTDWHPAVVVEVNDEDGTYDIRFTGQSAWIGEEKHVPRENLRPVRQPQQNQEDNNAFGNRENAEGNWHWEGMTDSEDQDWASEGESEEGEEEEKDGGKGKPTLTFEQLNALGLLVAALGGSVDKVRQASHALAQQRGQKKGSKPFTRVLDLAQALCKVVENEEEAPPAPLELQRQSSEHDAAAAERKVEAYVLLNLLYAPKRSRLHSLFTCLTRAEDASHIVAWTKLSDAAAAQWFEGGDAILKPALPLGCPPIDLVQLPRLKLNLTARQDPDGETRLYSMDHSDLFISNLRPPLAHQMLAGIPHGLLLANLQQEMYLLVPVVCPTRPAVHSEPFTTTLVLQRALPKWTDSLSARYLLYPVHVSWSFLITQGLQSSLYLILLKLLHRDYESVFRLADSIANDTKFDTEGKVLFDALELAKDDWHPNAHACRAKISLVTLDSGSKLPWDLTLELSRFLLKQPHVSANCRMSLQEELQLLESDLLELEEKHYDADGKRKPVAPAYVRMLVKNRQHALRARAQAAADGKGANELVFSPCWVPPRASARPWVYHLDKTVFGESYAKMLPVYKEEEVERQMLIDSQGLKPPKGGWLILLNFHVQWMPEVVELQTSLAELPSVYPYVKFLSLQADSLELAKISRKFEVIDFPTLVLVRLDVQAGPDGWREVGRVSGKGHVMEKTIRMLVKHVREDDKQKYAERVRLEKKKSGKKEEEEEEEEEEELLQWTWDLDSHGPTLVLEDMGMTVLLQEQEEDEDEVVWEYSLEDDFETAESPEGKWVKLPQAAQSSLETGYRTERIFTDGYMSFQDADGTSRDIQLAHLQYKKMPLKLTGFYFNHPWTGQMTWVRRRGLALTGLKNEPEDEEGAAEFKRGMAQLEQKKMLKERMRLQRRGKDVEAVRGNMGFERGAREKYEWRLRWGHEPVRGGGADAVGLCMEMIDSLGPQPAPLLGGKDGASLALYADGKVLHKGKVVAEAKCPPRKPPGPTSSASADVKQAEQSTAAAAAAAASEKKEKMPEPELAPCWGKGDVLTVCLDMQSQPDGLLTFKVNDQPLPGAEVKQVFRLFPAEVSILFPCVSTCPLNDGVPPDERQDAQAKKKKHDAQKLAGTELDAESQLLLQEAELTGIDPELLRNMDAGTRAALVQKAKKALESQREYPCIRILLPPQAQEKAEEAAKRELVVAEEVDEEEEKGTKKNKKERQGGEDVPIERVRWMFEEQEAGWVCHSELISAQIETAHREGKKKFSFRLDGDEVLVDFVGKDREMTQTTTSANTSEKLRRHVLSDGFSSHWELMSAKFTPPLSLRGLGALAILEKVWNKGDSMDGRQHGLGFLFLYSLLQGKMRTNIISSGWSYWETKTAQSDSHRFAILLLQLYTDSRVTGICGSILSILANNKALCGRMPSFRDTRKVKQTPVFNGWTDDREPRSPLHALFTSLVSTLRSLKRKRGAMQFPPRPPYPELEPPATECLAGPPLPSNAAAATQGTGGVRPILTDFACSRRKLVPVSDEQVLALAQRVQHALGSVHSRQCVPPVPIESVQHLEAVVAEAGALAKAERPDGKGPLFVLDFFADWCGPCTAMAPVFTRLAMLTPARVVRFLKVDIDDVEQLASDFGVERLPTVKFLRGGARPDNVVATILGGGPQFLVTFAQVLQQELSPVELVEVESFHSKQGPVHTADHKKAGLGTPLEACANLAGAPLAKLHGFCGRTTRKERGLALVDANLPFDLTQHDSARTAVAKSMLARMKGDVELHANKANSHPVAKVQGLLDDTLRKFFSADENSDSAAAELTAGRENVRQVLKELRALREEDTNVVQALIPLLTHAANHIDLANMTSKKPAGGKHTPTPAALPEEKVKFLLRRESGQEPVIWLQFLFSALLSSDAHRDLQRLNPYLSGETVQLLLDIVQVVVLRSNRVGHINRAVGAGTRLLHLLDQALALPPAARAQAALRSLPTLIQAGEALASTLTSQRHFIRREQDQLVFDPRFLIFEFTWNILLRKNQVQIVEKFVESLRVNRSRVKQMIMGAGKTTVVAPLLALILADGQSLVLSVVPRALLEMSRQRMRETFATIMQKRIYTLHFERSTLVTRSLHTSLQNAIRNRGIVVATPTAIKSVMLCYVETLEQLHRMASCSHPDQDWKRLGELELQSTELAKVLRTFREGVMLLDEVDLILHPLKSELNFPMGDKTDLDSSSQGERWGLPIHLMDAIFFAETGQVSTVEGRGTALEILKRLTQVILEGYECRALQRLPHITLLNQEFYHQKMKPILAEWTYLWLLQHHLHGISYQEALRYLLEGAATRSAASTTVQILKAAWEHTRSKLGFAPLEQDIKLEQAYLTKLPTPEVHARQLQVSKKMQAAARLDEDSRARMEAEMEILASMQRSASEQDEQVQATYRLEQEQDEKNKAFATRLSALQERITATNKEIEVLQFPRDDSLDNSTVVWVASAFSRDGSGGDLSGSDSGDTNSVHALATKLEDKGFTLRRCETAEEAAGRAVELAKTGRLRCVLLAGGGDMGCSASCSKDHGINSCDYCGNNYTFHKNHMCQEQHDNNGMPQRGFFPDPDYNAAAEAALATAGMLKLIGAKLSSKESFPTDRIAVYAAPGMFEEDKRLAIWNSGVMVLMEGADVLQFVERQPPWETEEQRAQREQEAADAVLAEAEQQRGKEEARKKNGAAILKPPPLQRQVSVGTSKLHTLQRRLEELEQDKAEEVERHEGERKKTQDEIHARHDRLDASIQAQLATLRQAADVAEAALKSLREDSSPAAASAARGGMVGPASMRDAALALAWLESEAKIKISEQSTAQAVIDLITSIGSARSDRLAKLATSAARLREACLFLEQMALASKVMAKVALQPKKLLNLSHDWLRTFLPHCLAKVNRVSFGLLNEQQCEEALSISQHTPRSRLKLAVPFVGKDVPSTSSEFAHPDVIIGLTVLAYRYNCLRRSDFDDLIDSLTSEFSREIGPSRERASSRRHETWVLGAGGRIRGIKAPLKGLNLPAAPITTVVQLAFRQQAKHQERDRSREEQVDRGDGEEEEQDAERRDSARSMGKERHKAGEEGDEAEEGDEGEDWKEVVQLKYLQKSNEEQAGKLYKLWKGCPQVIHYYLNKFIFPAYMRSQKVKISASGQAVGGDMLIGRRVGFSGTPSDLLPRELGACDYEKGDDGKMLSTVLDPTIASSEHLPTSWDAPFLLSKIAKSRSPRFHALIDTGALITGYTNLQVARELLARGLKWCDGVVFLDDADKQQVLVRATGRVVPADQCGVPLDRRFAFYDQIHTTGMDIKHVVNARAVLTLGKDMVFRDYVQGAFRMRGIGEGQTITLYIIPEVAELMSREIRAAMPRATSDQKSPDKSFQAIFAGMEPARRVLTEVVAWLVVNSMRSEQVQWNMLCLQNVANIYRKNAFQAILRHVGKLQSDATLALASHKSKKNEENEEEYEQEEDDEDSDEDEDEEADEEADEELVLSKPARRETKKQHAGVASPTAVSKKEKKEKKDAGQQLELGASKKKEEKDVGQQQAELQAKGQLQSGSPAGPLAGLVRQKSEKFVTEMAQDLDPIRSLEVFREPIDFSLEAGVPDVVPFGDKLRDMLGQHMEFILTKEQHECGQAVLLEVGQNELIEDGHKRLDTEQEREQEQEQQKEVQARRDQQIEVEKFVEREYSRLEETPRPWHISMLARPPTDNADGTQDPHPFYPLSHFKLRYQEPLQFPGYLYLSRNYFNPQWSGLRRVKNVIMLLEWSEDTSKIKVLGPGEPGSTTAGTLTRTHDECLQKAFTFLRHHASLNPGVGEGQLSRQDVANAIKAATDREISEADLTGLLREFGLPEPAPGVGMVMDLAGLRALLLSGRLHVEEARRRFVAVSLAEAETLRRILHLHPHSSPLRKAAQVQFALRFAPMPHVRIPGSATTSASTLGDGGGVIFDFSVQWGHGTVGMPRTPPYQLASAYNCFKYFDCDFHFADPALNALVRALEPNTTYQRELFFNATMGCRRRMARKWQDTPLAKLLSVPHQWSLLKQRSHAICLREALRAQKLTLWEAFTLFDADNNGTLAPSELYGALRVCKVPGVNGEDVIDLLESADKNRDGVLDYREWLDLLSDPEEKENEEEAEAEEEEEGAKADLLCKVDPYGTEELRLILVRRKQADMTQQREEKERREMYQQLLDRSMFQEELKASAAREGGANPKLYYLQLPPPPPPAASQTATPPATTASEFRPHSATSAPIRTVEWQFMLERAPLRCSPTGGTLRFPFLRSAYRDAKHGVKELTCPENHDLEPFDVSYYGCDVCKKVGVDWFCRPCWDQGKVFKVCRHCMTRYTEKEEEKHLKFVDESTVCMCSAGVTFSIQVPVLEEGEKEEKKEEKKEEEKEEEKEENAVTSGTEQPPPQPQPQQPQQQPQNQQNRVLDLVQLHRFTLTMELLMDKLAPVGLPAALFRFSPASMGRARSRHRASVYVDHAGRVGDLDDLSALWEAEKKTLHLQKTQAKQATSANGSGGKGKGKEKEKEKEKAEARIQAGRWAVLSVCVDASAGSMETYVDGQLSRAVKGLSAENLTLRHQLQVLGGGKVAQARGGRVRRLFLMDRVLSGPELLQVAHVSRRHMVGLPVALVVDSTGKSALQALCPQLKDKFVKERYNGGASREMEPVLFKGSDAAPDSLRHAVRRFVLDHRLALCVVNLQRKVWSVGLSSIEVLDKAIKAAHEELKEIQRLQEAEAKGEMLGKEEDEEENEKNKEEKEQEEDGEEEEGGEEEGEEKEEKEEHEEDEEGPVQLLAFCDEPLSQGEQEKLDELNVKTISSFQDLFDVCSHLDLPPVLNGWVANLTAKPIELDHEEEEEDEDPHHDEAKAAGDKKAVGGVGGVPFGSVAGGAFGKGAKLASGGENREAGTGKKEEEEGGGMSVDAAAAGSRTGKKEEEEGGLSVDDELVEEEDEDVLGGKQGKKNNVHTSREKEGEGVDDELVEDEGGEEEEKEKEESDDELVEEEKEKEKVKKEKEERDDELVEEEEEGEKEKEKEERDDELIEEEAQEKEKEKNKEKEEERDDELVEEEEEEEKEKEERDDELVEEEKEEEKEKEKEERDDELVEEEEEEEKEKEKKKEKKEKEKEKKEKEQQEEELLEDAAEALDEDLLLDDDDEEHVAAVTTSSSRDLARDDSLQAVTQSSSRGLARDDSLQAVTQSSSRGLAHDDSLQAVTQSSSRDLARGDSLQAVTQSSSRDLARGDSLQAVTQSSSRDLARDDSLQAVTSSSSRDLARGDSLQAVTQSSSRGLAPGDSLQAVTPSTDHVPAPAQRVSSLQAADGPGSREEEEGKEGEIVSDEDSGDESLESDDSLKDRAADFQDMPDIEDDDEEEVEDEEEEEEDEDEDEGEDGEM